MDLYWHGSPYLITDGIVRPGIEINRDRFSENRNLMVFVTTGHDRAIEMGQVRPEDRDHLGATYSPDEHSARFLYLVRPTFIIDFDDDRCPHERWLGNELVCPRARVIRAWKCANPKEPGYVPYHEINPATGRRKRLRKPTDRAQMAAITAR